MVQAILAALASLTAYRALAAQAATCDQSSGDAELDEDFVKLSLRQRLTTEPLVRIDDSALRPTALSSHVANNSLLSFNASGDTYEDVMWKVRDGWAYGDSSSWALKWPNCRGNRQSPINIVENQCRHGESWFVLEPRYKPTSSPVQFSFNGHYLAAVAEGYFGELVLSDGTYDAKQLHFHFPSEHGIDGMLMDGEMQIVHQRRSAYGTDGLAVISVFLQADGAPQVPDLFEIFDFENLPPKNETKTIQKVDLKDILKQELQGPYFYYEGSLTTPPCSETVSWYVLRRAMPINPSYISNVMTTYSRMNRPVYPLNERVVGLFEGTALHASKGVGPPGPPGSPGPPPAASATASAAAQGSTSSQAAGP